MSIPVRSLPSMRLANSAGDQCESLRREIKRSERLAKALVSFFAEFLDAYEIKEQRTELEEALTDWLTGDARDVIENLQKPMPTYATPEMLVNMCRERDRLRALIEQTEEQLQNNEMLKEMKSIVEIQLSPLRNQLEDLEEAISKTQAELEKQGVS